MAQTSRRVAEVLDADCGHNTLKAVVEAGADSDIDEFIAVLEDAGETPLRRQRAAFVLGRIGGAKAVKPLTAAAPRLTPAARMTAADALGRIGGAEAARALLKLTGDPDTAVRKFATKGLRRIDDAPARARLAEIAETDAEPFIRDLARGRSLRRGR